MRLLLHDFGGYPFPIELSRELASRGHEVMHAYCGSLKTTPGGGYRRTPSDPESLIIREIKLSEPLNKYSFVKRWKQENQYGRLAAKVVADFKPDALITANTPLDAQAKLQAVCRQLSIPFVFWLQDILSIATDRLLRKKLPLVGPLIGKYYLRMESRLLRNSNWNVLISEDFRPLMRQWGVKEESISVIENWAPLPQLPVRAKRNDWSKANELDGHSCIVYTGTMGMKHNPNLLLQLAIALRERDKTTVVVISEGIGAQWLLEQVEVHRLNNLRVFGFGPFEEVPDIMGTADILTAVLEPDAGFFSVPSKVLAYLCAQRALLLAVPHDNLAARIVGGAEAGEVVSPDDVNGFVQAAINLLNDEPRRLQMGAKGRGYAEEHFVISEIADRFESRLSTLTAEHRMSL